MLFMPSVVACIFISSTAKGDPSSATVDVYSSFVSVDSSNPSAAQTETFEVDSKHQRFALQSIVHKPEVPLVNHAACGSSAPLATVNQIDQASLAAHKASLAQYDKMIDPSCASKGQFLEQQLANVFESQNVSEYMNCAIAHGNNAALSRAINNAQRNLKNGERASFSCDSRAKSKFDSNVVVIGEDLPSKIGNHGDPIFYGLLLKNSLDSGVAREVEKCCSQPGSQIDCKALEFLNSLIPLPTNRNGISALVSEAYRTRVSDSVLRAFYKKASAIESTESKVGRSAVTKEISALCESMLSNKINCGSSYQPDKQFNNLIEFMAAGTSQQVASSQMGSSSAQADGTQPPNKAAQRLARNDDSAPEPKQSMSVRSNGSAGTNMDFQRYASAGPVTAKLQQAANTLVNEVLPAAYASPTASYEFHQAGNASVDGVPILVGSLNGQKTYVAASVPFSSSGSNANADDMTIVSGKSVGEVKRAYKAAVQQQSAAKQRVAQGTSDGAPAGAPGGGGGGDSGGPASASTGRAVRGLSSQNSDAPKTLSATTYKTVGALNSAIAKAENPKVFLESAEPVLRSLKVQYSCRGADYPASPMYTPTGKYDCDEVRRMYHR